jgi:hypothetical protein
MTKPWEPIRYSVDSDTLAIEIRPWPGGESDAGGGYDAGPDLVIHDAPDGQPWLWEIEHASRHPEHIAAALLAQRDLTDEDEPVPICMFQERHDHDRFLFGPRPARRDGVRGTWSSGTP